jgi:hypothetical protein
MEEGLRGYAVGRIGPAVLIVGTLLVAGATRVAHAGGGLYWPVPAVLVAVLAGLGNAWVLLVENQR